MPTDAEWTELRDKCTWTWTTINGIYGELVTSNVEGYTDKSIFLPAAGSLDGVTLNDNGLHGVYWSSTIGIDWPYNAMTVDFSSSVIHRFGDGHYRGQSIRPVMESKATIKDLSSDGTALMHTKVSA